MESNDIVRRFKTIMPADGYLISTLNLERCHGCEAVIYVNNRLPVNANGSLIPNNLMTVMLGQLVHNPLPGGKLV